MAILDGLTDLIYRLFRGASDPLAVMVELVLIALALNWVAGKLEGTRGTRPLRKLFLLFVVVTIGVRVMKIQFGWDRLEILYYFFALAVAFIALAAFQPELRRAFIRVGDMRARRRMSPYQSLINTLVSSAGFLSRNKYGALIAIRRSVDLRGWAENGTMMNAEVSANLIKTIFFRTPLCTIRASSFRMVECWRRIASFPRSKTMKPIRRWAAGTWPRSG
jgi:diadenylate cyclase